MVGKKICALILSTFISLNIMYGISAKAIVENQEQIIEHAKNSFNKFKETPVFNLYNETLKDIKKIQDEDIKNPMLWELAPYWDQVATKYVTTILDDMIALSMDKNLLSFHELMEKIENSPLKTEKDTKLNEEYLKSELAAWSSTGCLFSKDEVISIDSINIAWTNMTYENIEKAQNNIDKVVNSKSRQWLQGELNKIKIILKDKYNNDNPEKTTIDYKDFKVKQDTKTGLWGYIKISNGEWAIKPQFKIAYDFLCEHAWVVDKNTNTCGIISANGNWELEADELENLEGHNCDTLGFSDYLAKKDDTTGLWGFVKSFKNTNGKWIVDEWGIKPKFEAAVTFSGGHAWVKDKETGKTCLIDLNGNYIYSPNDNIEYIMFKAKQDTKTGLWGYIKNSNGEWIIKPQFKMAHDFEAGAGFVQDLKTELWGLINELGEWSIPPTYTLAE